MTIGSQLRPSIPRRMVTAADLPRPETGLTCAAEFDGLVLSGRPAFQSRGGLASAHPARQYLRRFEIAAPEPPGKLRRLTLVGLFALYASGEPAGAVGAMIQGFYGDDETCRFEFVKGQLYGETAEPEAIAKVIGDGTSIETVGSIEVDGARHRIDMITLDIPAEVEVDAVRFSDLGTPASFLIFDMFFEVEMPAGCPFHSSSGGVALNELPAIVRVGDRVRFGRALAQLEASMDKAMDIDEARGQCLTFLAIVAAATLEMGGPRSNVRVLLDTTRELDRVDSVEEIKPMIRKILMEVAQPLFSGADRPSAMLIDRALAMVDRNFAKNLTDAVVAEYVGLSTSHFRYLFRQATKQPFHRYLLNLRLEKAKALLQDGDLPVSQVASLVGFSALSHFSRAFSTRFQASPTSMRRPVSAQK